jgi:hypothetical protein
MSKSMPETADIREVGTYTGKRNGGENCGASIRLPESAENARHAARQLGAHKVTWRSEAPACATENGMEPRHRVVKRYASGRLISDEIEG